MTPLRERLVTGSIALLVAGTLWLPCLHLWIRNDAGEFRSRDGLSPKARQLAARHLALWTEPKLRELELRKMGASNAEWDFMGRSFLVWSLANMAFTGVAANARCDGRGTRRPRRR